MAACIQCGAELDGSPRFCPKCGSPAQARSDTAATQDSHVGRVFAQKFRVDRLLGEGGMGRVYQATHLSLDKAICLKVLRRELAQDPETQARFQREARAASRLNHPNSIQIIDFGAGDDGELYIAMELVVGHDLQQLIGNESPLSEERIRHMLGQVLDALSEAHAQKIIHRDLKPENIMVSLQRGDPDFVKVLDFGIAQIQDGSASRLTRAGLVCGTPEYMSPEQARGEALDVRSDLYSAGVILYQMATGRLPFQADTPMGFVSKHLIEVPAPPRALRPDLSEVLNDLILRALSKEREGRPTSAIAMRDELLATIGKTSRVPESRASPQLDAISKASVAAPGITDRASNATSRAVIWATAAVAIVLAASLAAWKLDAAKSVVLPTIEAQAPQPSPVSPVEREVLLRRSHLFHDFMEKGKAALQSQDIDRALKFFELAAHAAKDEAAPYREIGLCYEMRGQREQALKHYQRYVEFTPTPPDADQIQRKITLLKP